MQIIRITHLKRTEELASNTSSFSGKDKAKDSGVRKHNGLSSVITSMTWKKWVRNAYLSNVFQLRNHSLRILASCAFSNLSCFVGSTWCALIVDCDPFYKVTHMSVKNPPATHTHKKSYNKKDWGVFFVFSYCLLKNFSASICKWMNSSSKEIPSQTPVRGAGKSLLENA